MPTGGNTQLPSTDRLPSLSIPLRRAYVIAFWIAVSVVVALATAIAAAVTGRSLPWVWSGSAVVLMLLPRALSAAWFETGVRAWNAGARIASAALRGYVLFVCYHTLFRTIALAAGPAVLAPEPPLSGSAWRPRERNSWQAAFAAPSGSWAYGLRMYGRLSGSRWVVILLPILQLLAVFRDEAQDTTPSSSTYTLY